MAAESELVLKPLYKTLHDAFECEWDTLENNEAREIKVMTILWPQDHCSPLHRLPAELFSTPPLTSPGHVDTSPETSEDKLFFLINSLLQIISAK